MKSLFATASSKSSAAPLGGSSSVDAKRASQATPGLPSLVYLKCTALSRRGSAVALKEHKRILDGKRRTALKASSSGDHVVVGDPSAPPASSMAFMGSLVDPSVVYHFRIVQLRTFTAVANVWQVNNNLDPTQVAEWTTIDALFDEYKLVRAKVTLLAQNGSDTTTPYTPDPYVAGAFSLGRIGTAPANINSVLENPDSRLVSLLPGYPDSHYIFDTGDMSKVFGWLTIGGTQEPYAGWYGQFEMYGTSLGTVDVGTFLFEFEVALRCRS